MTADAAHITATGDTPVDHLGWARQAALAAGGKLGHDTVIIDVGDVLAVTDHFVVTGGSTTRQVRAIVEEVEARVAEAGGPRPVRIEGAGSYEWVLMDYGGFVVHVLTDEKRAFYDLERLWADRPTSAVPS